MSRRQDRSGEKDLIVSNLSQAITLLRQCSNAEDAKKLVDVGMAAKVYAQRRRLGIEAQDSATAFVLRAVRRLGEILTDTDRHQGGRPNGKPVEPERQVPKLRELGISRDLSSKAQRIATIPEKNFEFTLAHAMSRGNISVKEIQRRMLESADRFNDKPETPDDGPKINYSCPACGHGWHGKPKASGDGKPWFPCEGSGEDLQRHRQGTRASRRGPVERGGVGASGKSFSLDRRRALAVRLEGLRGELGGDADRRAAGLGLAGPS